MRYAFVKEHASTWAVATICRVLAVTRSGYYAWLVRKPSARQVRQETLVTKIRRVHLEHRCVYGSPRVHRVLKGQGEYVCRNTVARLMRKAQIRPRTRRTFVPKTTDSKHGNPIAPNRLERDFGASAPNQKWAADITCIATAQGWLYLAGVLDCHSRKVVGWSMAESMPTDLISDALKMAILRRKPKAELLHHSDRGCQYTSCDYRRLLERNGITASMSGKGDCYDNAMMESFWATLKTELVHHQHYQNHEQARASIFEYIEVFYNRKRLHSALGYQSPETFEAASQNSYRQCAH
jgi:transposase InsO family protein